MNITKILLSFYLGLLLLTIPARAADEAAPAAEKAAVIAGKPAGAQYPFVAEVTANNVFIRSRKGVGAYHCGKLQKGDRVTVVNDTAAWAEILPPQGSYSWIHKSYVNIDKNNPAAGVLSGNDVRVWAGSDYIEPLRSNSEQTRLNTGDVVELFTDQPQEGDYLKIKPPVGAHLWISSEYLRYIGQPDQAKPIAIPPRPTPGQTPVIPSAGPEPTPAFTNIEPTEAPAKTDETPAETAVPTPEEKPAPKPKPSSKEMTLINQCHTLSAQIDAELKKPLNEQKYDGIRTALEAIINEPEAGKAATYAKILTDRIARYELAISVTETLQRQDDQLAQTREQIKQAHEEKLKNLPKEFDFLYVGLLKPSHIYTGATGSKRYLLQDENGKILCYVTGADAVTEAQLEQGIDAKVGIRGNVVSSKKSLVTLVSATRVEPMTE